MAESDFVQPGKPTAEVIERWASIGASFFNGDMFEFDYNTNWDLVSTLPDPGIQFGICLGSLPFRESLSTHFGRFGLLDRIYFGHEIMLKDGHLKGIHEMPSLRKIYFDYCWELIGKGVVGLSKIKRLEELRLHRVWCVANGNPDILEVFSRSEDLRSLSVSTGCLNQALLDRLVKIPNLSKVLLDFWNICDKDEKLGGFWHKLADWQNLKCLRVDAQLLVPEAMADIPVLGNIEELDIIGELIDSSCLGMFKKLTNLRKLGLYGHYDVIKSCLSSLPEPQNLISIDLNDPIRKDGDWGFMGALFPALQRKKGLLFESTETNDSSFSPGFRTTCEGLADILENPAIHHLDLRDAEIGDEYIRRLNDNPRICRLDLPGGQVTNDGLASLVQLPNLSHIGLHQFDITEETLRILIRMEALKSADLVVRGRFLQLGSAGLKCLFNLAQKVSLRGISCLECVGVQNEDLPLLGPFSGLQSLILDGCPLTDQAMGFFNSLPRIHELDLSGTGITDAGLLHLGALCHLNSLSLSRTKIHGMGLSALSNARNLFHVKLDGTSLDDEGFAHLHPGNMLLCVNLSNTRITDASLLHLAKLEGLEELHLSDTLVTGFHLDRLSGLECLDLVDLGNTGIIDSSLAHLSSLSTIILSGTEITGSGLSLIGNPESVRKLDLGKTLVADSEVTHLSRFGNLRELSLEDTMVTDAGASRLSKLPQLKSLSLAGTLVTEACLTDISRLSRLEALDLCNTPMGDSCVSIISKMASLQRVGLSRTNVSEVAKDRLRGALPSCEVR